MIDCSPGTKRRCSCLCLPLTPHPLKSVRQMKKYHSSSGVVAPAYESTLSTHSLVMLSFQLHQQQFQLYPQSLTNVAKNGSPKAESLVEVADGPVSHISITLLLRLCLCPHYISAELGVHLTQKKQPKGMFQLHLHLVANHIEDAKVLNIFLPNSTHHDIMDLLWWSTSD